MFYARGRIPGQVPRLDPEVEQTLRMPPVYTYNPAQLVVARDVLRPDDIADGLGLSYAVAKAIGSTTAQLVSSSTNEIDFRQSLMAHLVEKGLDGDLRRAVFARAVSYYRTRGGRYHRRVTTVENGERKHRYYYDPTRYAARDDAHIDGQTAAFLYQEARSQMGKSGPAPGTPSPKKLAVGTKRQWHNRVVVRGEDDKWHVIGHASDDTETPDLSPSEIDPKHAEQLVAKLKTLIAQEHAKNATVTEPIKAT